MLIRLWYIREGRKQDSICEANIVLYIYNLGKSGMPGDNLVMKCIFPNNMMYQIVELLIQWSIYRLPIMIQIVGLHND